MLGKYASRFRFELLKILSGCPGGLRSQFSFFFFLLEEIRHYISGHYPYQVMPYGLASGPSVFQCIISNVLKDFLRKFCNSLYWWYYDTHLISNVTLFMVAHFCKNSKTIICTSRLRSMNGPSCILGYIMDKKSEVWVACTTDSQGATEVKGYANFYRRLIRNYSTIAAPLTSLLKGATRKLK